jgi:hypothetical protein
MGHRLRIGEARGVRCFFAAIAAVVVAGCGGASGAPPPTAPLPVCPFNESVLGPATLTTPTDRAQGVPVDIGSVTVIYQAELVGATPTVFPTSLPPQGGPVIVGSPFVVSGGGSSLTSTIPRLTAGAKYNVQTQVQRSTGTCTETVGYYLGQFST